MGITKHSVTVTTDSGGAATGYTQGPVTGQVEHVRYTPGAAAIDTNGDLDITGELSGVVLANHDNIGTAAFTRAYRQATHGVDGAAAVYAAAGSPVLDKVTICGERLKVVIANGGDTKSGTFEFVVRD